ncbi:MAG: hypothetical protein JWQ71_4974 [Pedosphaera sp.]|nr:hypothetical protein [Pedosphaera sp.]
MKYLKLIIAVSFLWLNLTRPTSAQHNVYSSTVVGYINKGYSATDYLIGNPLYSTDNTINNLFQSVPDGSTLTKWDRTTHQFLPTSEFSSEKGWSINYDLSPTEGALFHPAAAMTNTFTGEVPFGEGPIYQYPTLGDGLFLLSCSIPIANASFYQVIGRAPAEGESVTLLDSLSHNYYTTIFRSGDWDNGIPVLGIGEAGFFALGPDALTLVPEPATYVLLTLGLVAFNLHRRLRRRATI